jgi:predicted trehalose synthase
MIDLSRWDVGPIDGLRRSIQGRETHFRLLPLVPRFDLIMRTVKVLDGEQVSLSLFTKPEMLELIFELVELSDADEDFLDNLTHQIPLAVTALEINSQGLFEAPQRMAFSKTSQRDVVKLLRKPAHPDASKIAPTIEKYWFLYRPVYADLCSYEAMFIAETFSFRDISYMHELLDLRQFNDIVANSLED